MLRAGREVRDVLTGAQPTHRHLRDRLVVIATTTVVVDVLCAVVELLLERHAPRTEVTDLGSAAFFTTTQLLSVSSSMVNPVTTGGRLLDVFMELYAITVVAALAGSAGTFLHRRSREREAEDAAPQTAAGTEA
jgi:hypothetical protein